MKKNNLSLIVIVASLVLIVLNIIFTSNNMNIGFWLRILAMVLLIIQMVLNIRKRKRETKNGVSN